MKRRALRRNHSINTETVETRALLSTITVTSLGDTVADDGAVTLREALIAANTDQSIDGSVAGDGADTIVFEPSLNREVIQIDSPLEIVGSVSVVGNGPKQTIVRGLKTEIGFNVTTEWTEAFDVSMEGIRVTNTSIGLYGGVGGVTDRNVSVKNSQFRKNRIGISSGNRLVVTNTEFYRNNGPSASTTGAIRFNSNPSVTISRSKFVENQAWGSGGALYSSGAVTIDSSLFVGNRARNGGGALTVDSDLTVTNSTFTNNEAFAGPGGAIDASRSGTEVEFRNATIVDNHASHQGGGVYFDSNDITIANSVFAGNIATSSDVPEDIHADIRLSSDDYFVTNSFVSSNRQSKLDDNGGEADENGNMIGTEADPIDPMLGSLQDNGGKTHTMMPAADSPLIDAGGQSAFWKDQRATIFPRRSGDAVDIGAAEYADVIFNVTPSNPVVSESGALTTTFDVTLNTEVGSAFDLTVVSVDDTAQAGSDYNAVDKTLSFNGTKGQTLQFDLTIIDDTDNELRERLDFAFSVSTADTVAGTLSRGVRIDSDEKDVAELRGDTLVISGGDTDTVVSVVPNEDDIEVTINSELFTFPAADVAGIEATLRDGANSLAMDQSLEIPATVTSGSGNDTITTAGGDDRVTAGGGDDVVSTGEGADWIAGGGGNDTVMGGGAAALFSPQRDTIFGGNGSDRLEAGHRGSEMFGGRGRDSLIGGEGDDTLWGEGGPDSLEGGDGNDSLYGDFGLNDTMGGNDIIRGGDGSDFIIGGFGRDNIWSGPGHDRITAAGHLRGGAGSDRITVTEGPGSFVVAGSGADIVNGSTGDDTIYGGPQKDALRGGGGDDILDGQEDADLLIGGDGDDSLRGGAGPDGTGIPSRDILFGGLGADSLFGESGEDILVGGTTAFDEPNLGDFIRREWRADSDFATRQAILTDPNSSAFLLDNGPNQTVFDDGEADFVRGGGDTDWFFVNLSQDDVDGES